jgi:hypothetical protein
MTHLSMLPQFRRAAGCRTMISTLNGYSAKRASLLKETSQQAASEHALEQGGLKTSSSGG